MENIGATPNTLVIFTSDNGPWLAKNQGGGSVGLFGATSAPYRNVGKGSTWEEDCACLAFAYWPGKVPTSTKAHGAVLPRCVADAGISCVWEEPPSVVVVVVASSLMARICRRCCWDPRRACAPTRCCRFGMGQRSGKVGTHVYAARWNQYKFHWITSTGLISGSHTLNHTVFHDPPLVFDVEQDPSEAYPLSPSELPAGLIDTVNEARKAHVESFRIRAIDPRFGMKWALCCDRASNCTCSTPRRMPPEGPDLGANAS